MTNIVWSQLNWFDAVIAGIIILSILISFFRGFLREAISLATWIIGIVVGVKYAAALGNDFAVHISSPTTRFFVAFLIIFLIVFIVGSIVGAVVRALVNKIGVGILDRLLGGIFGALRGILAVGVILMFLNAGEFQKTDWLQRSQLTPAFNPLVTWLNAFVPTQAKQVTLLIGNHINENVSE